MKPSIVFLASASLVAATGLAAAESGMLPNGAVISWDKIFIDEGNGLQEPSTPEALRAYLNLAHCTCSKAKPEASTSSLEYEVRLSVSTGTNRPGEVWIGTQCDDDTVRNMQCRKLEDQTIGDIDQLAVTPDRIALSLADIVNGTNTAESCQQREGDGFAWILVDHDGDNVYDYFSNKSVGSTDAVTGIDTQPPPAPTKFSASGGEGSIDISWDAVESRATDIYAYQAFCARADDDSAGRMDPPARRYDTTSTVCDIPQELALTAADPGSAEGDVVDAPLSAFSNVDEAFLCGDQPSGVATSISLTGLENGVAYKVALVAVDFYGNATGVYFTRTITPKPVTDFWEDLQDRNSGVEGGCLDAGTGSGLVIGLLAMPFVLRRRRRAAASAAATVAAITLAHAPASADDFTPYWEDPSENAAVLEEDRVKWHAGIRLGPYIPDIDIQAGLNAITKQGPYESMFGDWYLDGKKHERHVWQILPMLDVDRIIWDGFGHIGVGGSIGYMQKTAHAYLEGTSEDDPMRPRSRTSKTKFRLIPLAATATYRFTYADERFGIPVVPYLRGGLSYYMWEIEAPDGAPSKVCMDGSDTPKCETNEARGASFGYQGSIGVSIRAERIDPDAAVSMRAGGIQHAGFYAEWSWALVDGFGSEKKLSVGDTTWFAGVDFEF